METRPHWLEVLNMWSLVVKRPKHASLIHHEKMEWSSLSVKIMGLNRVGSFWKKMRIIFLALIFPVFFQLSHPILTLNFDLLLLLLLCASGFGGVGGRGGLGREKLRKGRVPAGGIYISVGKRLPFTPGF